MSCKSWKMHTAALDISLTEDPNFMELILSPPQTDVHRGSTRRRPRSDRGPTSLMSQSVTEHALFIHFSHAPVCMPIMGKTLDPSAFTGVWMLDRKHLHVESVCVCEGVKETCCIKYFEYSCRVEKQYTRTCPFSTGHTESSRKSVRSPSKHTHSWQVVLLLLLLHK